MAGLVPAIRVCGMLLICIGPRERAFFCERCLARRNQFHAEFEKYQRRRRTRENAHLYVRHDAYRYMAPGAPFYVGQDVVKYGWPCIDSAQTSSKHDAAPLKQPEFEADPEFEAELRRLRCEVASLRLDWELTKLSWKVLKYNPNQPRVPVGIPMAGSGRTRERKVHACALPVPASGEGRPETPAFRMPRLLSRRGLSQRMLVRKMHCGA